MSVYVITAMRLIVGGIFLYSGWEKLMSPVENFIAVIDQYQLFPPTSIPMIAHTMPWLELFFGASLVIGYLTRLSAALLGIFLVAFICLLARSILLGLSIAECGCFGAGLTLEPYQALILDGVLLVFGILIWIKKGTFLSMDKRLQAS